MKRRKEIQDILDEEQNFGDESPEGVKYTAIPRQPYRPGFDGELSTDDNIPDDEKWMHGVSDLPLVLDFLYIKQIEKQIGRYLDSVDLLPARYDEPVFFETLKGYWDTYKIPVYDMPSGLQLQLEDLTNAMIAKALWKRIQGAA